MICPLQIDFLAFYNESTNIIFKSGIEPTIEIQAFTNENTIYIDNQYSNSFFVNAVIPISDNDVVIGYGIWTEEMESDFVEDRINASNILMVYRSINIFSEEFDTLLILLYFFIMGIITFIVIILGSILSRTILNPIISISEMAEKLIESDFSLRIKSKGIPEMRLLINRFNIMAGALKHHLEMQEHAQKLNAWHDIALNLAHEIKNPLTPIMINVDYIKYLINKTEIESKEKIENSINIIMKNIKNIEALLNNFSQFSFETIFSNKTISINKCLEESVNSFNHYENIDFNISYTPIDYYMIMDKKKMIIAFTNIIKNATEAIEPKGGGYIYISTYHEKIEAVEYFIISITDTGIGIKKKNTLSIFEPYYTSKEKGTGLGLSLVETIIKEHGGTIEIDSIENEGTTFFIKFKTD